MGRPVKNFWDWNKITIPYSGDYVKVASLSRYLYSTVGDNNHHKTATLDYKYPRKRHANKVYTSHTYYIKDPVVASYVALKWS